MRRLSTALVNTSPVRLSSVTTRLASDRSTENPLLFRYAPGDSIAAIGGTFSRTSAATQNTSAGGLETVSAGVLRDSHYIGGIRTTLLEGQRTNLFLQSEAFKTASWTKSAVTVTSGIAAPDGTANGEKLVSSGDGVVYQEFTLNGTYALSGFFKQSNGALNIRLKVFNNGTGTADKTNINADLAVPAQWGQLNTVFATGANEKHRVLYGGNGTFSAGKEILIFGGQLELGGAPSSYIKTTTAQATRAADALSFAGRTWPSQLCTQFERWIDSNGVTQTSVVEFTGTTPQPLTLFRAYRNVIVAKGSRDLAFFTALL